MQAERAHQHTHSPTPQPGVAGRSRNPSRNTDTDTAHLCQEWMGASGARTRAHTQPNTPARSGGAQPKPEPKHTNPHRAPQPGVASASGARTRAHTQPNSAARSGGAQPKPEPKHTHPHRATSPGVARCKRSARTSTHTAQHPSQEWRGAAETRAQTHTPTPRTRARSCWMQAEHAHKHAHRNTPARNGGAQLKPEPNHNPDRALKPGVAGCKRSTRTSTHIAQHPSQEWRGAAETRAQTHKPTPRTPARSGWVQVEHAHKHAHRNTRARSGGAQPKPEPKHIHPHRAPQPGVTGCKRSAHTSPDTAQQPSEEWRGAAETRAQTHTPTPRTPARSGWVQAERAHEHTHSPTPQPGVADAAETRAQTHTSTPRDRARSGWVQAERAHEQTHSPTPQPGVAGRSRNRSPNTHTHSAHLCQEWLGASRARARAHTQPTTPASSGGAQPKPEPKHTHPHRGPQPGVAGCKRSAHTSPHTAQHPGQEWRGAAETRAQTHTPTPRTLARSG